VLDLAGDGELVVFVREAATVFVCELADGDAADGRRCEGEAFEHGGLLGVLG
jgi:hypothetical protein